MSKCTKFAGNADGITWDCTRERDHDGPCAMALTMGERCPAQLDWHPRDADLRGDTADCELRAGHDGPHRATLEWT